MNDSELRGEFGEENQQERRSEVEEAPQAALLDGHLRGGSGGRPLGREFGRREERRPAGRPKQRIRAHREGHDEPLVSEAREGRALVSAEIGRRRAGADEQTH